MDKVKSLAILFIPSPISAVACGFLSFVSAAAASIVYAQRSGSLYKLLFDQAPPLQSIEESKASFGTLTSNLFVNHRTNVILTILFWALVGLIAYVVVFLIQNSANSAKGLVEELNYVHADTGQIRKHVLVRVTLFCTALILIIFYLLAFFIVIFPLALYQIQSTIIGGDSVLQLGYAFLLLMFAAHIFVILLRFSLLRSRIFR